MEISFEELANLWGTAGEENKIATLTPLTLKPWVTGEKTYDPHGIEERTKELPATHYATNLGFAQFKADDKGLEIVYADDFTLQLDFDTVSAYTTFLDKGLPILRQFIHIKKVTKTESEHGNTHVYIHLFEPLNATTRVAIQAALGSDPVRELLNILVIVQTQEPKILMFEKDDNKPEVIYSTDGSR